MDEDQYPRKASMPMTGFSKTTARSCATESNDHRWSMNTSAEVT